MAARNPRKRRSSKDSASQKPARRRNRRAEAAASPWWFGPPEVPGDEGEDSGLLAAHKLFGMFDMLAGAIEEERRERITIRRGRPSKKAKALAEAESLVEVAEGFETERAREIARKALELSPDCARAHVLLAELSDDVHAAEREYRLGVAAGERALGAAVILQRLLQLAGPDVAVMVVSDHGFHSDHLRPKFTPRVPAGITVWHRPQGMFAAAGTGFKADDLVFGARLLDVAPTVLHWFGLPVGDDMEGRVLEEAFDPAAEPGGKRRPVARIPTHEPPGGRRRARAGFGEAADKALLDQFVALGYIDELPADPGQAAAETNRENDWNMARALMHGQRYAEALPLLESCFHARPFRTDYAQLLASCQLSLGLLPEADATVDRARDSFGQTERADLIKASIAIQRNDHQTALEALERVREKLPDDVQLGLMLARSHLALRRFDAAEAAARQVLALDPHNPQAFLVQARIALRRDRPADAVEAAVAAIGLQYGNPMGHWLLGAALYADGRLEEAEKPLRNSLTLSPDFLRARRLLSRVLRGLGRREEALAEEGLGFARARAARERAGKAEAENRAAAEVRAEARAAADQVKQAEADRKAAEIAAIEPLDILVVSGLPRSGTSLMMQMLRAGGIEPLTDGERAADEDNLEGYFEWEDVKKLPKNPRLIEQAAGKAVKVISALLSSLPAPHRYTVIYMVRPVEQVVDSQWTMLGRRGQSPRSEKRHLIEVQEQHSRQIRKAVAASDRVTLLEVSYPELVADPAPVIDKLAALLPGRFTPSPAVAACVKPTLYRNRGGTG